MVKQNTKNKHARLKKKRCRVSGAIGLAYSKTGHEENTTRAHPRNNRPKQNHRHGDTGSSRRMTRALKMPRKRSAKSGHAKSEIRKPKTCLNRTKQHHTKTKTNGENASQQYNTAPYDTKTKTKGKKASQRHKTENSTIKPENQKERKTGKQIISEKKQFLT